MGRFKRHDLACNGSMRMDLRLGTLNVRSLNGKESQVYECARKYRMDVLGLSEVKMKGEGMEKWGEYTYMWSGVRRGRAREGVGVIVSDRIMELVRGYEWVSSRLMWMKVKIGVCKLRLVIMYAPTNDKSLEEREYFWDAEDEVCASVDRSKYLVLLGDMNGRVGGGRQINDKVVGKWGDCGLNSGSATNF